MTYEENDRTVLGYWDGLAAGAVLGIALFTIIYLGLHVLWSLQ